LNGTRLLPLLLAALLTACGHTPPKLPAEAMRLPERVELLDIPYFHDPSAACAPSALAGVLGERGITASPGLIEDSGVGKQGDLRQQVLDLVSAKGLTTSKVEPRLTALLDAIAANRPVLLERRDRIDWLQQCRYAVLIGYDRRKGTLMLQTGDQRRVQLGFDDFEAQWARADHWAITLQ
jgi:hypothetical protein